VKNQYPPHHSHINNSYLAKNYFLPMQPSLKIFILSAFLILSLKNLQAQQTEKPYEKEWKKINELITEKRLPQSALEEVKKIYTQAKKEKQEAQVIKALVYMSGLRQETREDNGILSIREMEQEITTATQPAASILQSLAAAWYWNYFQSHRWNLYDRTETTGFNKEDIATWSAGDFYNKISALYGQSIREEALLKNTKLEPYDAIIIKGNVRHLRPTLYDLLAHQALYYFQNDERDISRPAYAFEISMTAAFDPAADFIHRKFVTRDSASLHQKALLLYQDLIAFHLEDKDPAALIDVDLARLQFVKEKSTHPDKEQLYRTTLSHIISQYNNTRLTAQAFFLLADAYNEDADEYKPLGDTAHRFDRLKAKALCEKVMAEKDSTEGWINCYNLLQEIGKKELSFRLEKVNLPGKPFRVLVEYKNIPTLHLRLVRADQKLKDSIGNYYNERSWEHLLNAPVLRSWQQYLPDTKDYQQHTVEIPVDALNSGEYILLVSSEKEFNNSNAELAARLFYVSNISYVSRDHDYFVLHRETGRPLEKASVQVWQQVYDYKTSRFITEKAKLYATDKNGYFREEEIKEDKNRRNRESYRLEIRYQNDRLFMDDWNYSYWYSNTADAPEKDVWKNRRTFFFTDRSIYRPGQTVFFKAIVTVPDQELKNRILSGFKTKIYLQNANQELIDSLELTTNEYGSVSGKFQLPGSGLNGQFSIREQDNRGNTYFSVEEYKRPKFYVEYEPLKQTYRVSDEITVTGLAKAYAGNNIDGATVRYRVVRQPRFLYPWVFRRWWYPRSPSMEITQGEATTDAEGKFEIRFEAIPDRSIDKKFEPVFDYRVYADVTDINGETRSGETSVSVSYKSLIIKSSLPSYLPADSMKTLSIRTENMNGEFQPSLVKVSISRLKEEKRLIRPRYWQQADQYVLTREAYIQLFPHDEYARESEYENWEKQATVFSGSDSVRVNSPWPIGDRKFEPGFYVIEITTMDKNGEEVKDIKYTTLYDSKNRQLGRPQYLWTQSSEPAEPGEKASVSLGSSADNLFVIEQVDRQKLSAAPSIPDYRPQTINDEIKTFSFPVSAADRGGFGVTYFFIKDNRFFQFNDVIRVPWTNKELKIDFATFRDKTLPGSEEKWKVRITGYKNEKVAAEMLASMYDASLDQFNLHRWSTPYLWPGYSNQIIWNSSQNFINIESERKPGKYNTIASEKKYDRIITGIYNIQFEGLIQRRMAGAEVELANRAPKSDEVAVFGFATQIKQDSTETKELNEQALSEGDNSDIRVRKNFNETAFFFPDLHTDSSGAIEFSFTAPEALTKWKLQALAHSKELAMGLAAKEMVTQKELMVQPNAPRFLREGDRMEFSTKVVNLTGKEITGQAQLLLFDATTQQPVDGWFQNMFPNQYFTVAAGQSEAVKFPIEVPYLFNRALTWRIVARAGDISDGEENTLPVLTNRMLVTESLPLNMKGSGTRSFRFEKLLQSGESETLKHHALTVEYSSSPAWYAVQALPYLMEFPYECAEQTWNRYYANALAARIAGSSPKLREVFEKWKTKDTAALLSNLQKNEELKSVLLEETPWVLEARNEEEQKKNIALLFDLDRMSAELDGNIEKLKQLQSPNGGFVWFKGGPDNRYITQYIVTGIGHLYKLNAVSADQKKKLDALLETAIPYLDKKINGDYEQLVKSKTNLKNYAPGSLTIQYLYMRSFFISYDLGKTKKIHDYFLRQACKYWMKNNQYQQGLVALALYHGGDKKTPAAILKSLKETSILHEELGRYWKDLSGGWYWYQAPVETQSLLIEAFLEISRDIKTVDELKTWLLRNKQTTAWKTTKATAEACYALLLQGNQWLNNAPVVTIRLGDIEMNNENGEEGTGYFKKKVDGNFINPSMGTITVNISPDPTGKQPSGTSGWGSVYWQYFEDLDKITPASTPLSLVKKLFVETNTDQGPVLSPVNEGDYLKVGDRIKVRIELRADRDMEYVHLKDMRAVCMEPVNVFSGYKWQGGLGYYETTKDAGTHFFFDYLLKGTYVFEYTLFVTHKGEFSNGVTTIQCMYAPEFSSHSEGIRVNVE